MHAHIDVKLLGQHLVTLTWLTFLIRGVIVFWLVRVGVIEWAQPALEDNIIAK